MGRGKSTLPVKAYWLLHDAKLASKRADQASARHEAIARRMRELPWALSVAHDCLVAEATHAGTQMGLAYREAGL